MSNVLVILGSPVIPEKSVSSQAANYFVEKYKEKNQSDEVKVIDLVSLGDLRLTRSMLSGEPTESDQEILTSRKAFLDEFLWSDKIVISSGMWDFSLPGTVKEAIDSLCVAGTTFKYLDEPDETGSIVKGLVPNKKVLFIQAMGGMHRGTPNDLGFANIKTIFNFLGIDDVCYVAVQGVAIPGIDSLEVAKLEIDSLVETF